MSALSSRTIRAISPHRKTLLASVGCHDASACTLSPQQNSHLHGGVHPHRTAALGTSCRCEVSRPQPTYTQPANAFRGQSGQRLGRGRGAQRLLHRTHLSSWAKSGVGSIFNGVGAFAANVPNRLTEEIGRLVGRSRKNSAAISREAKVSPRTRLMLPALETPPSKLRPTEGKTAQQETYLPDDREQHTFEKAMEDTNYSISSYYHAYTAPQYTPVKVNSKAKAKAKAADEEETEASWGMFAKIPLPFIDNCTPVKKRLIRKDFVSRSSIEARTRALVSGLKTASSYTSKVSRLQDLCKHLKQYPSGRYEATEVSARVYINLLDTFGIALFSIRNKLFALYTFTHHLSTTILTSHLKF